MLASMIRSLLGCLFYRETNSEITNLLLCVVCVYYLCLLPSLSVKSDCVQHQNTYSVSWDYLLPNSGTTHENQLSSIHWETEKEREKRKNPWPEFVEICLLTAPMLYGYVLMDTKNVRCVVYDRAIFMLFQNKGLDSSVSLAPHLWNQRQHKLRVVHDTL